MSVLRSRGATALALTAACVAVTPALAAPSRLRQQGALDLDATALLFAASQAARELTYHGTQIVSFWSPHGSTSAVFTVSHDAGRGMIVRLDPTPAYPGGVVFRGDSDAPVPDAVGFSRGTLALLRDNYVPVYDGIGRVAGRAADIVSVRRPGASVMARFWVDRETRLILRRQVLDSTGRTLRESVFITLDFDAGDLGGLSALRTMPVASGERLGVSDVALMRERGWRVPGALPGGLGLFDARRTGDGRDMLVHLSYSDGLSTVSLFQQRGRLDTGALDAFHPARLGGHRVYVADAVPRRVVWSGHGVVYTLVADCEEPMLEAVIAALPHGTRKHGLLSRVGRGIARVGSWVNPFA